MMHGARMCASRARGCTAAGHVCPHPAAMARARAEGASRDISQMHCKSRGPLPYSLIRHTCRGQAGGQTYKARGNQSIGWLGLAAVLGSGGRVHVLCPRSPFFCNMSKHPLPQITLFSCYMHSDFTATLADPVAPHSARPEPARLRNPGLLTRRSLAPALVSGYYCMHAMP